MLVYFIILFVTGSSLFLTSCTSWLFHGLQVEVLNALGHVLNFTYNMTETSPDHNWGDFENGSWTGMLGMVHRGEKNFTVNFFGYSLEKMRDFDASSSYWMEGFGLTLRVPAALPRWRAAYYPFSVTVWACAAGAFIMVVALWRLQVGGGSGSRYSGAGGGKNSNSR